MPGRNLTITATQRVALYEQVRNHLGAINDLWLALEKTGDFTAAERLAKKFSEDFRLLADLGWDPNDREEVELTMPTEELAQVLKRLHTEAEGGLGGPERQAREAEEAIYEAFRLARDTCEELLARLDLGGGEAA
jgi:hypothetical protein